MIISIKFDFYDKCFIFEKNDSNKRVILRLITFNVERGFSGYRTEKKFQIIKKNNKLYLAEYFYDFATKKEINPIFFQEIKHYTTIKNTTDCKGHALIGAKTVSSFFNSIKSLDEAIDRAMELYYSEQIILDDNDMKGVDFAPYEENERRDSRR